MIEFEKNIFSILKNYSQDNFLVAVSGGADSMALLCALCNSASLRDALHVLHVEHGIRPAEESKGDADFVRSFCEKQNIPCTVVSISPGKIAAFARKHNLGIEAAARHFRRRALLREAKCLEQRAESRSVLILTAHTKDDALELSLMRILRGAGPTGLAWMPVKRGRFLRPLLDITRAEVIAYLKEKNIPWREDSTNNDENFLRNKIRHKLIPLLNELQGTQSWKKGVAGMSATQSLVAEFLNSEAKQRIFWENPFPTPHSPLPKLTTDENNFFAQPQIIREESLFQAINLLCAAMPLCEKFPKRSVIRQFCEGGQKAADLGAVRLTRKNGQITISPAKKEYFEKGISRLIN